MKIIALKKKHFKEVRRIYQDGLDTGVASFETIAPEWSQWKQKFLKACRFVAIKDNQVVGWCALSPVSKRDVYRGVAESTIYIAKDYRGQGVGKRLLNHLVIASQNHGFWTLQASIFKENPSSIHLHQQCGYNIVGERKRIAQRQGTWYDNILLEHRNALN